MKVLITGTTQGIGKAIAQLFLEKGHTVYGIYRQKSSIVHDCYTHYTCDIRDFTGLDMQQWTKSTIFLLKMYVPVL